MNLLFKLLALPAETETKAKPGYPNLLDLPLELREQIYRHALHDETYLPRHIRRKSSIYALRYDNDFNRTNHAKSCPRFSYTTQPRAQHLNPSRATSRRIKVQNYAFGLFLTSRAIGSEAASIFFHIHHSHLQDCYQLHLFLENTPHAHLRRIKSVSVGMCWHDVISPAQKDLDGSLRSGYNRTWPPPLSESISQLCALCSRLKYLELIPHEHWRPEESRHLVEALCSLGLEQLSIPMSHPPSGHPLQKSMVALQQIEQLVNARGAPRVCDRDPGIATYYEIELTIFQITDVTNNQPSGLM